MKTLYVIQKAGAPPAVTESLRAAEYWQRKGCTITTILVENLDDV